MKIGVQLHPQATTLKEMRSAWRAVDSLGVDSLWTWDHFYPLYGNPDAQHFECYTLLAAMAADTKHVTIGALVTCYTYRNPHLLADMARTIDHISDGRFVLGLGSGWFERDYKEYDYEFGTAPGRLKILEKGLPIIKERMSKLNPGPVNGKIPLMIGGSGEKVTLRLVAQYADQLNTFGPPDNFKKKNDILNEWCQKVGRNPKDIERTVAVRPEELDKVDEYAAAGADHMIVMLGHPYDLSGVEKFVAKHR
jgi:probable F420-dependent oxidoreductase